MSELDLFVKLSKFAGERFDLTQAGGGNSSVKLSDGNMLIKASGYLLSEVSLEKGYTKVDNKKLLDIFDNPELLKLKDKKQRESFSKNLVDKTILSSSARPSIETLLHALLQKYVLHTHPVSVNAITCRSDWKEILKQMFPASAFVHYQTPGLELSFELKKELELYKKEFSVLPKVIFLQNHGIIVGSDDGEEIFDIYEEVVVKISAFLNLDLSRYKLPNQISSLINTISREPQIAYLSEDRTLYFLLEKNRKIFFTAPFCPDTFVFCGYEALELEDWNDSKSIVDYQKKYSDIPKVILFKDNIFFIAPHLKKAREMEDVFKFHLLVAEALKGNIEFLSEEELRYLGNWEAEKYRQKL
jgi:rhamnose utilization protein RhaD (predicted bifunctional aldolase and dehydrogenase)